MKVLFQSRVDLFSRRGGDTIQIEKTTEELRRLGVEVEIDCSADPDLSGYDLVHLFNIDWPAQVYLQARNAKKQGKPIVFSPIHHSHQEIERYEKEARYGLRRITNFIFRTRESREKFKDFCRMIFDPKKIPSTLVELRKGILNEQKELLEMADLVLVQTEAEAKDLETDFSCKIDFIKSPGLNNAAVMGKRGDGGEAAVRVVNGVDERFAEAEPGWFIKKYDLKDFILCVGRIEPRKNQLAVIGAVSRLRLVPQGKIPPIPQPFGLESRNPKGFPRRDFPSSNLLFVGKISWRHPEYALRFLRQVQRHSRVYHIPQIHHEKMGSCYAAAKVHVLASWFETTGLVNLEAALAGANVVATGERAREYLLDFAHYCDPGNTGSIAKAIVKAWKKLPDPRFREHILKNFTWKKAAEQTRAAYEMIQKLQRVQREQRAQM